MFIGDSGTCIGALERAVVVGWKGKGSWGRGERERDERREDGDGEGLGWLQEREGLLDGGGRCEVGKRREDS